MNRKVRLDRLKKLKYILDNHDKLFPVIFFDMQSWESPKNHWCLDGKKIPSQCTTAACALGSAGHYPPFRKAGLKTKDGNVFYKSNKYDHVKDSYEAGQFFFGITLEESFDLFAPNCYPFQKISRFQVLAKVKKMIKKYEANSQ